MLGLRGHRSNVYYPQNDGQTERTSQVLEVYIVTFVNYDQNDWY